MSKFIYSYFERHLVRGAQFSEAGLNGALMKRKNNTKNNNRLKKMEQLSIAKVLKAQFGLDLNCLFRPNPNLIKSCSLLRARGSVFQILAPLNLKDPWYLVQVVAFKRLKTTRKLLNRQAKNWSQWLMRGRRLPEL